MKPFFGHRGLVILLGIGFGVWSVLPSSLWLEWQAYHRLAGLLPALEIPQHSLIIRLDTDPGTRQFSYLTLSRVIASLEASPVDAIGLMLPLDQAQTMVDAETREAILNAAKSIDTSNLAAKLDPDAVLAKQLRASRKLVIGVAEPGDVEGGLTIAEEEASKVMTWLLPLLHSPSLHSPSEHPVSTAASPSLQTGFQQAGALGVMAAPGYGERVSAVTLVRAGGDSSLASLLLLLSASALQVRTEDVRLLPGTGVRVGYREIVTDAGYRVYPRLPTSDDSVAVISADDFLAGKLPNSKLKDRIVLLSTDTVLNTSLIAPGGRKISPVHWQAHALNAVIAGSQVNVPYWSHAAQRAGLVLVLLYLILLPQRLRGWPGLVIAIVGGLLILNAEILLLVLYANWLPLGLPLLYLLSGQVLLWARHHALLADQSLRRDRDAARVELADNLRNQGQLDKAMQCLTGCEPRESVLAELYELGLEFERRRQFTRASKVYEWIASARPRYRDIRERLQRQQAGSGQVNLAATTIAPAGAVAGLVVDDPNVAKPVLGRYELERELGRGAMGTVYLGRDPRIGRTVAIKTLALSEEFDSTQLEDVRRRFFQEAETAGRLSHPDIVTIYDVGEEHDLAYIAMDYIQGESLDEHVHPDYLLPVRDVFAIGIRVALALDYAHSQKVVHRDVKPGNILYAADSGQLKVTDFGIAHLADNSKTRTGTVLGSPYYMSPEQIAGQRIDGRSDLFSLGVTLYQLFSGQLPFQGDNLTTLMYQITNHKPQGIRKLRPELPNCLTRIINKALDKKITGRFETGEAMADALQRCAQQSGYA